MKQLSGIDASFLNMETGHAPLHIGCLAIYDQSSAPGERVTFKGILANIESRLHRAACFREKIVQLPFGLDHPYWIEDADFDLEFHVRHIALPRPGDWRQLCIQAARIHSRPLDRNKPLWEMYVIEGLDGVEGLPPGSFAIQTKIHHAAIDGVSGAEIMAAIHDFEPSAVQSAPDEPRIAESEPTLVELALRSTVNNIRQPLRFAQVLAQAAPPVIRNMLERRNLEHELPAAVPRTRFNGKVSPNRVFEAKSFSLADVGQIRKCVKGATVNDVILCVCGGALRRYLDHHDHLPRASLSAFAPISVRTEDQAGSAGNQVSGMFVCLHSDEADPLLRLEKVRETTRDSKQISEAIGARSLTDVTQFMPGPLAGVVGRLVARTGLMRRMTPLANCVISNLPGPQVPLYFTKALMVANFGLGLSLDGLGLFHAVLSYNGAITVSIVGCREQLPDPGFYAECLDRAFAALREAALV